MAFIPLEFCRTQTMMVCVQRWANYCGNLERPFCRSLQFSYRRYAACCWTTEQERDSLFQSDFYASLTVSLDYTLSPLT